MQNRFQQNDDDSQTFQAASEKKGATAGPY